MVKRESFKKSESEGSVAFTAHPKITLQQFFEGMGEYYFGQLSLHASQAFQAH